MNSNSIIYLLLLLSLLGNDILFAQEQIGETIEVNTEDFAIGQNVSISANGTRLVSSGYGKSSYGVKVYDLINDTWVVQSDFNDTDFPESSSVYSTALSSDGTILAVGSVKNSFVDNFGNVKVYQNINGNWIQLGATITAKTPNEYFGHSIDLSKDGKRIVIGAMYNSETGNNKGRVSVYTFNDTDWEQTGDDLYGLEVGYKLGSSVSISGDGNMIVLGGIGAITTTNTGLKFLSSGSVNIFNLENNEWLLQTIFRGMTSDFLGRSVLLSEDGGTLLISASQNEEKNGFVWVYKINEDGSLRRRFQTILGSNDTNQFGRALAISNDGSRFAVSSIPYSNLFRNDRVRIYQLDGENYKTLFDFEGSSRGDNYGTSISFSSDGNSLAIAGLKYDFNLKGSENGFVNVYNLSNLELTDPTNEPSVPEMEATLIPNPVNNILSCFECSEITSFLVFDVSGKKIIEIERYSGQDVSVAELQSGLYYVYLTNKNNTVSVLKIIKE